MTIDVPVLFRAPLTAPRGDLVGVVDMAHHEPVEEPLWEREPMELFVKTGQEDTEANLMLLFRRPVPLPPISCGLGTSWACRVTLSATGSASPS